MQTNRVRHTRRNFLKIGGAAIAAAATGCGPLTTFSSSSRPPNIVIYLSDTLRASHTEPYGYHRATSPSLTEFAQEGILFENCISPSSWTKPAIGTIFTGVSPRVHRAVLSTDLRLGADIEGLQVQTLRPVFDTLAESLKSVGYHTAHFLLNPHCQHQFGFGQGFDHYLFSRRRAADLNIHDVMSWIRISAKEPFFIFLHELQPHGPYKPSDYDYNQLFNELPSESIAKLAKEDKRVIDEYLEGDVPDHQALLSRLSPDGNEVIQKLYDADILLVDNALHRLVRYLKANDLAERTVVGFVSDHGEGFNEHGFYTHGNSLFDELIQVPLILGLGGLPKGLRVKESVRLADLFATLTAIAGAPTPDYVQSQALVSAAGTLAVDRDRPAVSYLDRSLPEPEHWGMSLVLGRHKIVASSDFSQVTAYDREVDAEEMSDLWNATQTPPHPYPDMLEMLKKERQADIQLATRFGEPEWVTADKSYEDELNALGYI